MRRARKRGFGRHLHSLGAPGGRQGCGLGGADARRNPIEQRWPGRTHARGAGVRKVAALAVSLGSVARWARSCRSCEDVAWAARLAGILSSRMAGTPLAGDPREAGCCSAGCACGRAGSRVAARGLELRGNRDAWQESGRAEMAGA
ncbi:MAG: hypothetical protein ACYDHX_04090 [Methanothrix sp.]